MQRARFDKWRVPGLILASGVLCNLAYAPFHLSLLVFVALVPWLVSLRDATPRQAWKRGYGFGLLFALPQLIWIPVLIHRWVGNPVLAVGPWIVAGCLMAIYFGLIGIGIQRAWSRGWLWAIPLAWAGMEVFRSYIPVFAFPWSLLAAPLWRTPLLLQSAWLGSVVMVSAWLVASNVVFASILVDELRPRWRPVALAFGVLLAFSVFRYGQPEPANRLRVSVIQPGVDMAFGDPQTLEARLVQVIEPLLRDAAASGSKVAVLPEGVVSRFEVRPRDQGANRDYQVTVGPNFAIPPGLVTVFGGQRISDTSAPQGEVFQTAIAMKDRQVDFADKTRLVIFGEFVPGRSLFPGLKDAFRLPSGDLSAAKALKGLETGDYRIGPMVCFEGLFADIGYRQALKEPDFLVTISNDDWFQGTPAMDQLRGAAVLRAVETGLPLLRAGSLGYSLAVSAKGDVISEAPFGKSVGMQVELRSERKAPFVGFIIFPLISLIAFVGLLFWKGGKRSEVSGEPKRRRS